MRRIRGWLLLFEWALLVRLLTRLFARTHDDAVGDLLDRLTGWCGPHARLR